MSVPIDDGGPAFPGQQDFTPDGWNQTWESGMALRDYFAAKALIGLLSKLPVVDQTGEFGVIVADKVAYNSDIADSCYQIADAMLEARKVKQ